MTRHLGPLLLGALPLLLGSGPVAQRPSGLHGKDLPSCTGFLVYEDGSLRCVPELLLRPRVQWPDCTGQLLTARPAGDVSVLACTPAPVDRYRLEDLEAIEGRLAALLAAARDLPPPGHYVGVTEAPTSGAITRPGTQTGLLSANGRCDDQYPGARMCTFQDLHLSLAAGLLSATSRLPKAWIYAGAGSAPGGGLSPTEGLADSCAGYSYGLDDRGWTGTAAEWTLLPTGVPGFKFFTGQKARCSEPLPIACCR